MHVAPDGRQVAVAQRDGGGGQAAALRVPLKGLVGHHPAGLDEARHLQPILAQAVQLPADELAGCGRMDGRGRTGLESGTPREHGR